MQHPASKKRPGTDYAFGREGGHAVWSSQGSGVAVRFAGWGAPGDPTEVGSRLADVPPRVAWAKQVHGARVLEAATGACGDGDALWTDRRDLAVAIVTADCVPVVVGGGGVVAAIHAGWRGIVAGVVTATLGCLPVRPDRLEAWIGPAIGPEDYEVGEDVAEAVVAASAGEVARAGSGGKPHLDLSLAVTLQLRRAGVERVRSVETSTRSDPRLASYRRDGNAAGRNVALAWLSGKSARDERLA